MCAEHACRVNCWTWPLHPSKASMLLSRAVLPADSNGMHALGRQHTVAKPADTFCFGSSNGQRVWHPALRFLLSVLGTACRLPPFKAAP